MPKASEMPGSVASSPLSGRCAIGGISLLLVVALACSGAVGANDPAYFGIARAAAEAARMESGLPRPSIRSVTVRKSIVPAVPFATAIRFGTTWEAESIAGPEAAPASRGLRLALHLIDLPPPRA